MSMALIDATTIARADSAKFEPVAEGAGTHQSLSGARRQSNQRGEKGEFSKQTEHIVARRACLAPARCAVHVTRSNLFISWSTPAPTVQRQSRTQPVR